jgi:hypothetical protein
MARELWLYVLIQAKIILRSRSSQADFAPSTIRSEPFGDGPLARYCSIVPSCEDACLGINND